TFGGGTEDAFVARLNWDGSSFIYSTYLGGTWNEFGAGIDVDREGYAYVTGATSSDDFPGNHTPLPGGADAFVVRLTPDGSRLVFSRVFGGDFYDAGYGIAVTYVAYQHYEVYVTGFTQSPNF